MYNPRISSVQLEFEIWIYRVSGYDCNILRYGSARQNEQRIQLDLCRKHFVFSLAAILFFSTK